MPYAYSEIAVFDPVKKVLFLHASNVLIVQYKVEKIILPICEDKQCSLGYSYKQACTLFISPCCRASNNDNMQCMAPSLLTLLSISLCFSILGLASYRIQCNIYIQ